MDLSNFGSNERLDVGDFLYSSQNVPLGLQYELAGSFLIPQGQPVIVTGFEAVVLNGMLVVNNGVTGTGPSNGSAFLGYRDSTGAVKYGLVMAQNTANQSLNVASFAAGTYNVYVRFNLIPGTQQNRAYYNPANNGSEFPQLTATRLSAVWELRVETLNPGAEWVQIAQLVVTSSSQTATDKRVLYFEGSAATANPFYPTWGSNVSDRTANRATGGIKDLRTMLDALRQCIVDLKGPSGSALQPWWSSLIGGQNIGNQFTSQASTDGRTSWGDTNFYMQGSSLYAGYSLPVMAFNDYTYRFQVARSVTALYGQYYGTTTINLNFASGSLGLGSRVGINPAAPMHVKMATGTAGILAQFESGASPGAATAVGVALYSYGSSDPVWTIYGSNSGGSLMRNFRVGCKDAYHYGLYAQSYNSATNGDNVAQLPAWEFTCTGVNSGYSHQITGNVSGNTWFCNTLNTNSGGTYSPTNVNGSGGLLTNSAAGVILAPYNTITGYTSNSLRASIMTMDMAVFAAGHVSASNVVTNAIGQTTVSVSSGWGTAHNSNNYVGLDLSFGTNLPNNCIVLITPQFLTGSQGTNPWAISYEIIGHTTGQPSNSIRIHTGSTVNISFSFIILCADAVGYSATGTGGLSWSA